MDEQEKKEMPTDESLIAPPVQHDEIIPRRLAPFESYSLDTLTALFDD